MGGWAAGDALDDGPPTTTKATAAAATGTTVLSATIMRLFMNLRSFGGSIPFTAPCRRREGPGESAAGSQAVPRLVYHK
ncbi:hypothetical protein GCM10023193_13970 [Planotetraspora kaengkrachanensis]